MKIIIEGFIPANLPPFTTYQLYNCLDSAVTAQLLPVMKARLNEHTAITYNREMRVMALCLEMSTKGFPIDEFALAELDWALEKDQRRALSILHRFCAAIGFRPCNPNSTKDVPELFYSHLGIPAIHQYDRKTKTKRVVADIKALEKIRTNYPITVPFVNAILAYREVTKLRSVFKRGLEPGSPLLRCNFSPSGTDTGRLSSQQNPFGRGTNAQNLTDRARGVIAAPKGYAILNLDLKTAESIAVGFISGSPAYIDACMGSDLHTSVSRLTWPSLDWTDDGKLNRAIAESPYYRHFSYRDMAKRGGHATNYYGQPPTIAKVLNLPTEIIAQFQAAYFAQFPEIAEWQLSVIAQIMQTGVITTRLHRERRFWDRSEDPATHRAAIAFDPQSLVADVCNEGLIQVQQFFVKEYGLGKSFIGRKNKLCPLRADLRAQVHDAGVFLVPINELADVAPIIQQRLLFPVDFGNRGVMKIPSDMTVGRVWSKDESLRGHLRKYTPGQALHW